MEKGAVVPETILVVFFVHNQIDTDTVHTIPGVYSDYYMVPDKRIGTVP